MTSSWASQFVGVLERLGNRDLTIDAARRFFAGDDVIAKMQPLLYAVSHHNVTRVCQRQASCCRYYLLPTARYCASCPLVSTEEPLQRNRDWITKMSHS